MQGATLMIKILRSPHTLNSPYIMPVELTFENFYLAGRHSAPVDTKLVRNDSLRGA